MPMGEYSPPSAGMVISRISGSFPAELTLKEHEAARWLSAHQLDSVNWLPADLQLLDEL